MTEQNKTKVPAELIPAGDYPVVSTDAVMDKQNGKTQEEVNEQVDADVETLQQADTNLQGQITAEVSRASAKENSLDNRLSIVEELAEISVEGGTIGIASSEDFTNRTPAGDAKIPTVGAVLGGADDIPTAGSDNLVKSGGVLKGINNAAFNHAYFDGANNTYKNVDLRGFIKGKLYKLTFKNTTWSRTNVPSQSNVLINILIKDSNGSTLQEVVKIFATGSLTELRPSYTFTAPDTMDYLTVGGRADIGERVDFVVEDITDLSEVDKRLTTNLNDALLVFTEASINEDIAPKTIGIATSGNLVVSENHTTYLIKNRGYKRVIVWGKTNSSYNVLTFFNGNTVHAYEKIAGYAGDQTKKLYNYEVPDSCKMIGICTETATMTGTNPFYYKIYGDIHGVSDGFSKFDKEFSGESVSRYAFADHKTIGGERGQIYASTNYIACATFIDVNDYNINGYLRVKLVDGFLLKLIFYKSATESAASAIEPLKAAFSQQQDYRIPDDAQYFRFAFGGDGQGLSTNYPLDDIQILLPSITTRVKLLEDDCSDLKTNVGSILEDSVANINKEAHNAIAAAKLKTRNYPAPQENSMLAFLIATDIHADWNRLVRAFDYADTESLIDATFVLGDVADTPSEMRNYDYASLVLGHTKPVLTIPGNHEVTKSTNHTPLTDAEFISKFYTEDMVAHNGDIHPSGKVYWYRDFSHSYYIRENQQTVQRTKSIRVIGLDQAEYCSALGYNTWYMTQEQIDWLLDVLDNTPSDTYVMILTHSVIDSNTIVIDGQFSSTYYTYDATSYTHFTNKAILSKIVGAWIDGASVNVSSTNDVDNTTVSVNHTFTGARPNKFIGFISGHSHKDGVFKILTDNRDDLYQILLNCTSASTTQQNGDTPRESIGKLQDCLTVVVYDWFAHAIKLIRVGANVTASMEKREMQMVRLNE